MVVIEVTNHCNLECIMCEHPIMQRKKMFMELIVAKKILKECADLGVSRVILSRLGEPLLHPEIAEIISYAKECGIRTVSMVCNGTLLNDVKASEIISAGLDWISFSIDAAKKETFEKIRPGSNFEVIIGNMERFIEIRNNLNRKKPWVEIHVCLMKENIEEVSSILEKWRPLVNRIKVWPVAPLPQSSNQLIVDEPQQNGKKKACDFLWTRLVVLSNGQVTVCCGDREGTLSVGNAKNSSIKELWNSKKIRLIRQAHFQKTFDKLPVCKKCFLTDKTWWKKEKSFINKYEKEWKPLGFLPSSFFS